MLNFALQCSTIVAPIVFSSTKTFLGNSLASHRLNFTKAALLKAPAANKGARDYHYDEREAGLMMAITAAGSKSFYLYKRIEGRPERLLLGKFPDMTVEQARKKERRPFATR